MNLRYILIRWIISAIAILVTTFLVPGIEIQGNGFIVAFAVAFILGLVNAIVRPILILLSCGCIVATLGLFMLVINTFTLWLASQIGGLLGLGFTINGLWPAFLGSIVISIVSWLLSLFLIGDNERS
jgi:putative membrane protein